MALLTRALSLTPITSSHVMRATMNMPGMFTAKWCPKTMGSSPILLGYAAATSR